MNFIEYKSLEHKTLSSKNSFAIGTLGILGNSLSNQINNYHYSFADLSSDEKKLVNKLLDLDEDTLILGHDLVKLIGNTLTVIGYIDFFLVLDTIDQVVRSRNFNQLCKDKLNLIK